MRETGGSGTLVRVYRKPPHVAHARDGDRVILLHMETGSHVQLSPHATRVWDLVLEVGDAGDVATQLAEAYPDTDPGVIAADVARLLDDLVAQDLLSPVSD